jgi:hypothetical protein
MAVTRDRVGFGWDPRSRGAAPGPAPTAPDRRRNRRGELAHRADLHRHRRTVLAADLCGCFCCLATFLPTGIVEWVDTDDQRVGQTAVCPRCGIGGVYLAYEAR